jgi:nucleotide-binding universal stress UspA family protein
MPKLVCGIDDSEPARAAVRVTTALSAALGKSTVLIHVVPRPIGAVAAGGWYAYPHHLDREAVESAGEELLARVSAEFELPPETEGRVEIGAPATVLAEVAEDESVDLLVVGTRRRGWLATAFLGSVSAALVARAPCPVVVVPPDVRLRPGPVLCAVDDSAAAHRATLVARRLSYALEAELVLVHAVAIAQVVNPATVEAEQTRLARGERSRADALLADLAFGHGFGTDVERRVVFGSEADAIAELAEELDASLVVIGTRRRGPLKALLVGSVSFELRTRSPLPVVVAADDARVPASA